MPGGGTYKGISGGRHVSQLGRNTGMGRLIDSIATNGLQSKTPARVQKIIRNQPCLERGLSQLKRKGIVTCNCVPCLLWKDEQSKKGK